MILNEKKCFEIAKKCQNKTEMKRKYYSAYKMAEENDWVDNYDWFVSKKTSKFDYESVKKIAMKYKSNKDFRTKSSTEYRIAYKNDWLKDFTWLKSYRIWDYETCMKEAKKYKSLSEFFKKNNAAYQAARKHGWLDDCTWFKRPASHNIKWTYEECYKEAKKFKTRSEFHRGNTSAYNSANKNGWMKDYEWMPRLK